MLNSIATLALVASVAVTACAPSRSANATASGAQTQVEARAIASGLDTPWALAFAPDGRLFVTERGGQLRVIEHGQLRSEPLATLADVRESAEGGLMGLAVDPNFPAEPYLYTMYTYEGSNGPRNRVVRLRLDENSAREDAVLIDDLPASRIHDGGRVEFGPDGLLYVSAGDAAEPSRAQDGGSPAGKILRIGRDGSIPADNPNAGSPVYSLGHRNSQGFAWQPGSGRLYATEHGPSGNDEVNLLEPGQNYGWPDAQGPDHPAPFRTPLAVYSPAVAPAGATFYDSEAIPQWRGSFFFASLRGEHLRRLVFDEADPRRIVADEQLYQREYGRLRDVAQGPDGALYVATSNRDGRGSPSADDDRVLRIAPR
jgi:glucose/arabinose dehydrogenase